MQVHHVPAGSGGATYGLHGRDIWNPVLLMTAKHLKGLIYAAEADTMTNQLN